MSALRRSSFISRGWNPRQLPRDLNSELDTGHPLANGLIALYAPGLSFSDLVFPQNPVLGRPSAGGFATSPYGPAWNSPTSASGSLATTGLPVRLQSQNYTLIWLGKTNGSSGSADQSIMSVSAGGGQPFVRAGLFLSSSSSFELCADDGYQGTFLFAGDGHHASDLVNYAHIAGTFTSGAQFVYFNGSAGGTVSTHPGTLSFNTALDSIGMGDSRAGPGVTTAAGFFYNRVLSADEIARHVSAPFSMLRPVTRRMYFAPVSTGGSSVFFAGLARSQGRGQITSAPLVAPLFGKSEAQGAARATESQSVRIIGLSEALARSSAAPVPVAPLLGTSKEMARGSAAPVPVAPLLGTSKEMARGSAAPAPLVAPLLGTSKEMARGSAAPVPSITIFGKTLGAAQGRASSSAGSILFGAARAGGASVGRAAAVISTTLIGISKGQSKGKISQTLSISAVGKTIAAFQAKASTAAQATLFAAARASGAFAGRAAAVLSTSMVGKTQSAAKSAGISSLISSVIGRTQSVVQAKASTVSQATLSALARSGGASAGRAAMALSTALSAKTQGKGSAAGLVSAATALVGKMQARAQARASSFSGAVLIGFARAGGASAGRAAVRLTTALSGITTARAKGRLAGTLSIFVQGKTLVKSFGRLFSGEVPPNSIDARKNVAIRIAIQVRKIKIALSTVRIKL